jgi:XTP/dITP diphosphohydrolase
MVLYAATTNAGKLRDFAWAAEGHLPDGGRVKIAPLPGLKEMPAPAEDGATFEVNARLKAEYYSRHAAGMWVVADDSGLEGDAPLASAAAMGIAPSGEETDQRNNATLLRLIGDTPVEKRAARYKCVLALARDGEVVQTAEGSLEGTILFAERGAGGFGYDPLFWLPEVAMTMAEIDPGTRMQFSHRARALRVLLDKLELSPLIARDVR